MRGRDQARVVHEPSGDAVESAMHALKSGLDLLTEDENVRAWIESADGSIARGRVEALSDHGARIRLAGTRTPDAGTEVAVRLSFDPASPTVGKTARVLRVSSSDESSDCELEWTPEGA
jgi:hypothetical protein